MRKALATLLVCSASLTACDSAEPGPATASQPNPDAAAGKADGATAVEVVEADEPLYSTTFKRMLCGEITPRYHWDTVQQRDAFQDGCTEHRFTVTEMTNSTLYTHADDGDAITMQLKVRVDFEDLSFETSLTRVFGDYQFSWDATVDSLPEGVNRDELIQDIADEVGEYFWGEDDPDTFRPIRFDELPAVVQATAREREDNLNEALGHQWEDNGAGISDEGPFEIMHEGQVIGYVVSIDYWIEDSLFDGGGTTVYLNTLGDVVEEIEWWG